MGKINLRFITDHADLFRDENNNLVVNLIGVDEDELNAAIADFHEPNTEEQATPSAKE